MTAVHVESRIWRCFRATRLPGPLVKPFLRNTIGLTLENDIYLRPGAYDPSTIDGLALLGHELVHVGQYRDGTLTRSKYFRELLRHGSGPKNKYETPAYDEEQKILNGLSKENCGCSKQ